eukprot:3254753-Amphidinium_carterae.1
MLHRSLRQIRHVAESLQRLYILTGISISHRPYFALVAIVIPTRNDQSFGDFRTEPHSRLNSSSTDIMNGRASKRCPSATVVSLTTNSRTTAWLSTFRTGTIFAVRIGQPPHIVQAFAHSHLGQQSRGKRSGTKRIL